MPAAIKSPSNEIVIEYASAGDCGADLGSTRAHMLVLDLARALARMAAREDDAAENCVIP